MAKPLPCEKHKPLRDGARTSPWLPPFPALPFPSELQEWPISKERAWRDRRLHRQISPFPQGWMNTNSCCNAEASPLPCGAALGQVLGRRAQGGCWAGGCQGSGSGGWRDALEMCREGEKTEPGASPGDLKGQKSVRSAVRSALTRGPGTSVRG